MFNMDDFAYVTINGRRIAKVSYCKSKKRFPISKYLKVGANQIRFTVVNTGDGYTWGFKLWRGNRVLCMRNRLSANGLRS